MAYIEFKIMCNILGKTRPNCPLKKVGSFGLKKIAIVGIFIQINKHDKFYIDIFAKIKIIFFY